MDKVNELEHKHLGHERICAERYEQIKEAQRAAKEERAKMHEENKQALANAVASMAATTAGTDGRIDRLYNRAWAVAGAIMTGQAAILAYLIKRMIDP